MTKENKGAIIKAQRNERGTKAMKTIYYWMHKEYGYIIPEDRIMEDAMLSEYDDITDPTSCEYMNFNLYYTKTNMIAY